jgi:hypothetical protein
MRHRAAVSIAALAIVLAAGCNKKPDDAGIITQIQSQMFSEPQLKDTSLQVASNHGEVTLSGTVPSDAAHLEAYKIASQTPGVSKVDDQVTVEHPQDVAERAVRAPAPEPAPPPRSSRAARARMARADSPKPEQASDTPPPAPPAPPQESPVLQPAAAAVSPPAPPQPRQVEIPAGTTVTIRMIHGVDSSVNHAGEIFHASLEAPVVEGDQVIVSKGADVYVRLVSASAAGKFSGKSELHLELVKLEWQGRSYPLVSSTYSLSGDSRGKNTAAKVGAGAVLGTLLGAIAGGGKGAAIGATVGAAGGGVYQGTTKGKQVRIPSETKLNFQLDQPVTITVMPRPASLTE